MMMSSKGGRAGNEEWGASNDADDVFTDVDSVAVAAAVVDDNDSNTKRSTDWLLLSKLLLLLLVLFSGWHFLVVAAATSQFSSALFDAFFRYSSYCRSFVGLASFKRANANGECRTVGNNQGGVQSQRRKACCRSSAKVIADEQPSQGEAKERGEDDEEDESGE